MKHQGKHIPVITAIVAVMTLALSVPATAITPPGAQIQAAADASYTSDTGDPMPGVISNTVTVTVDYPANVSIGQAKQLPDGQFVSLMDSLVTVGTADIGGAFCMQSTDRSAGIRVATTSSILSGDMVTVAGTLETVNGERRINALEAATVSMGNPLPEPLGLSQSTLAVRPDNTGMMVRLWGTITSSPAGSGYFYISDGSGATGVRVYGTAPTNPIGQFVTVTGIHGKEVVSSAPASVIRTFGAGSVVLSTQ